MTLIEASPNFLNLLRIRAGSAAIITSVSAQVTDPAISGWSALAAGAALPCLCCSQRKSSLRLRQLRRFPILARLPQYHRGHPSRGGGCACVRYWLMPPKSTHRAREGGRKALHDRRRRRGEHCIPSISGALRFPTRRFPARGRLQIRPLPEPRSPAVLDHAARSPYLSLARIEEHESARLTPC